MMRLRDGGEVLVRQIGPGDREQLAREFAHLSDESRYRRFLVPVHDLTDEQITYLTNVDHHRHEALVALEPGTGRGVGVARYVRDYDRPDTAEAAVTVVDDWQGRGVGTLLLEALAARAREEGVDRFTALLLARNDAMIELLRALGPVRVVDREAGTVEVEVALSGRPEELSPQIRALLRLTRAGAGDGPRAPRRPPSPPGRAPGRRPRGTRRSRAPRS